MPHYIKKVLKKYNHKPPPQPVYAPHKHTPPTFGATRQYAKDADTSPTLDSKQTKFIQGVVGSLLYYSRAIDSTMLTAINEISRSQAKPTENTMKAVKMLLDYAATYPDVKVRFHASDMILHAELDAAYLVLPEAKSRIAGYFYLSNHPPKPPLIPTSPRNGPLHIVCKTLRHVVASAAEAETAALFFNSQEALPIRYILSKLGHKQPPTPMKTDNSTSLAFIKSNIRQKRSKSWDMRLYWLRDRIAQQQFNHYWQPGVKNDADYFMKHQAPKHHLEQRKKFIHIPQEVCSHKTGQVKNPT